jgi:catechol 2,3-dioxygenase
MKDRLNALPKDFFNESMTPYGVNHGIAWSLYCHDPEGNRIEMFVDSPFYVRQPLVSTLDLSMSDDEILQETSDKFGDDLSFKPWSDWSKELAERL